VPPDVVPFHRRRPPPVVVARHRSESFGGTMKRLAFVVLALLARPAFAGNDTSLPAAPELYPTLECVGLREVYVGDDNQDATAHLEWRAAGATAWKRGVDLTRLTNNRWAGSILWLTPGTSYEARVVVSDPDGGATSPIASVTTRPEPTVGTISKTYTVATNGSDTNPGTATAPFRTIGKAVSVVQPGQEIQVQPGTYYESIDTPRSGASGAFIHLTGQPGAILDGSDPSLLHTAWTNEGGGIYSIAWSKPACRLVYADSTQRLFYQATLANLQSNAFGVSQGFAVENGRLYVKLEDGSDPGAAGREMHIARYATGVTVDQDWWHVSGLTIQYYGIDRYTGIGVDVSASANNWIANNVIYGAAWRGIFIRNAGSNDNLIEQNRIADGRLAQYPWLAVKSKDNAIRYEESPGISMAGQRGNVIRRNIITGMFDGLDGKEGQEFYVCDTDWQQNLIQNCGDDVIEVDDGDGINLRFFGNTTQGTYNGISVAGTASAGPMYVLYNLISEIKYKQLLKLKCDRTVWFCHNTFADLNPGSSGLSSVWPVGLVNNCHWRNNIMIGNTSAASEAESGEAGTGDDFDGDLLYVIGSSNLFRWGTPYYKTLATLQAGTGFESHGKVGNPMWTNPAAGDYHLLPGSPAIDAGVIVPGIDDMRFAGKAPDIGAFESGTVPSFDTTPPAAINDLKRN
jgi:Right handed beta helix region/Protein of unknown function (DUF1565)